MRRTPRILFALAVVMIFFGPALAAPPVIEELKLTVEFKEGMANVTGEISLKAGDPVKEVKLDARQIFKEKIENPSLLIDGKAVPLTVTEKKDKWANREVIFRSYSAALSETMKADQALTVRYTVKDALEGDEVVVPVLVPTWKLEQEGRPFVAQVRLPKGKLYQGKSVPIVSETVDEGQGVIFRNMNAPAAMIITVGDKPAGLFTYNFRWTVGTVAFLFLIGFVYLRWETGKRRAIS